MSDENTLTPAQCRAARSMLGWNRDRLAEESGVSRPTLADFEANKRKPYGRTLADVRRTMEEAGIMFVDRDDIGGVGVRFRSPNGGP